MNLCFVGCGSIAEEHAKAFRRLASVHFHTVVGRRIEAAEEFARAAGFNHFTLDLGGTLSRPDIDAVVITSPSDMHAAHTEASLRAGKHALTELPLATNYGDAERAVRCAEEEKRTLMVAYTHRFDPALREVRRRVTSGELHIHHAVCRWFLFRRENVNWKRKRRSWTDDLLWHHTGEALDALLWMMDAEVGEVYGRLGPAHKELGIPMDLNLTVETRKRQLITIAMSYSAHMPLHEYFLIGEEETLKYENGLLLSRDGIAFQPENPWPILEQNREFVAAIREGRAPCVSGRSVLPVMSLLQQVRAAGRVP